MRRYLPNILSIAALLLAALSATSSAGAGRWQQIDIQEGAPTVVSYQGLVTVEAAPFNGTGYFKFVIVDAAGNSTWSNNGTSVTGSEPTAAVALTVANGLFNVLLGDTTLSGMSQALTYNAFATPDTYLRVWFSADGATFQKLSPDRRLAAAPYAMQAEVAKQADAVGGYTGDQLSLIGHKHAGADINSGTVGAAYIDGTIARTNQILPTVLNGDGAGSGLDADLLDGQHGKYYTDQITPTVTAAGFITRTLADSLYGGAYTAGAGLFLVGKQFNVNFAGSGSVNSASRSDHKHPGTDITSTISSTYIDTDIARLNQITTTVLANDGSGSGLDADLLDGQHAAAFVTTANAQTITGTKTFSPTTGAPFAVGNTTKVTNLNADLLDGVDLTGIVTLTGTQTIVGTKTFSPTTGAPFAVGNATLVTNLNADLLDGQHGAYYQARVSGTCQAGSTIKSINADGTVNCEFHDTRPVHAQTEISASGSFSPSIAIGADGLPLISYYDSGGGDLEVVHCNNPACTTYTASTLDSTNDVGQFTSITIGSDGLGLISYYDGNASNLKVAHCNNITCTTASLNTLDSTGDVGSHTSITTGRDGYGVISYYDASNTNLKIAHCKDATCSTADLVTPTAPSGWTEHGKFTSITMNPATGYPVVTFYAHDSSDGNLGILHCTSNTCSGNTAAAQEINEDTGYVTSVTVGADGYLVMSYWQSTNGQLRFIHCTNTTCGSGSDNERIVDDASGADNRVRGTAITVGADGLPLILYYDPNSSAHLKLAHCNDVSCSDGTGVAKYDTGVTDTTVEPPAITVGVDGMPIYVYRESTTNHLQVVHCSNSFCVPYLRTR